MTQPMISNRAGTRCRPRQLRPGDDGSGGSVPGADEVTGAGGRRGAEARPMVRSTVETGRGSVIVTAPAVIVVVVVVIASDRRRDDLDPRRRGNAARDGSRPGPRGLRSRLGGGGRRCLGRGRFGWQGSRRCGRRWRDGAGRSRGRAARRHCGGRLADPYLRRRGRTRVGIAGQRRSDPEQCHDHADRRDGGQHRAPRRRPHAAHRAHAAWVRHEFHMRKSSSSSFG